MEWLILMLVVPAILVPVVLLWGFAGCGFRLASGPSFATPTNVHAEGISESVIRVTWDNPSVDPVTFQVKRCQEGDGSAQTLATSSTTLLDAGLEEAQTYFYTVRTFRTSDNAASDPSEKISARTFGVAFEADLTTNDVLEGYCLVQRIEPARLRLGNLASDIQTLGARVRITVRGSTTGDLILDRIYISQPAASGDPYDAAADLTQIASGFPVPANTAVALPLVDYDLDKTRALLIAFDISENVGAGNVRFVTGVPATDASAYLREMTHQASINDRSPSAADPGAPAYVSSPSIYLVEKIELV